MDLTARVAWAINDIKEKTSLSWPKLANILGTNKNTVADYANEKGEKVLGVVIEKIVSEYKYSAEWLLEGKGEPYPGARERHPEVCGFPIYKDTHQGARDKSGLRGESMKIGKNGQVFNMTLFKPESQDNGHENAFDMLSTVLKSGDQSITRALLANLHAFSGAVTQAEYARDRITALERENTEIKGRMAAMEEKLERLMAVSEKKTEPQFIKSGTQ
ncbi:MAG: hypothetical protein KJ915_13750, partial [Candidatus Omnitrophica bacterium]|nr:hypothetical protein [Candidatus Omnitrophota bacterium]